MVAEEVVFTAWPVSRLRSVAFAENVFVDHLITRQMKDHFDFDRRYAMNI